ncbi:FAD-binding domain [Dillenia turbinata]|uniref:FAD-binding domain n=1 Tax=Dillenia turbinata TaxID=194707 RepID=A0AAN8W5C6_9MAGN
MEVVEDIVIVGAGIAGLATAVALHRMGYKGLVLESSPSLRVTGFAFLTWTNAWKALDAIGIGDSLRAQHDKLITGEHELRCTRRRELLEALAGELPSNSIRFSSKIVSIEESGYLKRLHFADGSTLKTKVLIGCDGVNSVVAKWLGLSKPVSTGRYAVRGLASFKERHGFESKFFQLFGEGTRSGFVPCDERTVYWFFTWTPSPQEKEIEENPAKTKEFVLSKLGHAPENIKNVVENTELDGMTWAPLRFRPPWELLWGNISKDNVCVAGDAFHPMTPDIAQGACSALEDAVVLARCLAEAFSHKSSGKGEKEEEEFFMRIKIALKKFANERKWRGFELISTAYMIGSIQQSNGKIMTWLRDKMLAPFLAGLLLKRADFDCGKLSIS